jgi:hypothetical protein
MIFSPYRTSLINCTEVTNCYQILAEFWLPVSYCTFRPCIIISCSHCVQQGSPHSISFLYIFYIVALLFAGSAQMYSYYSCGSCMGGGRSQFQHQQKQWVVAYLCSKFSHFTCILVTQFIYIYTEQGVRYSPVKLPSLSFRMSLLHNGGSWNACVRKRNRFNIDIHVSFNGLVWQRL